MNETNSISNTAEQVERDANQAAGGSDLMTPATGMLLAAIAYDTNAEITAQFSQGKIAGWNLAWLPTKEIGGNFAYIAYHSETSEYTVAIRGSVVNSIPQFFEDWFGQDFKILKQVDWDYPLPNTTGAKISQGAADGLSNLNKLSAGSSANIAATDLLTFLLTNTIDRNCRINIVGHSLGGALTTVFAMWLYYQFKVLRNVQTPNLMVMSYAAPSVGNPQFAAAYDSIFGGTSFRFYNQLDIVPLSAASIGEMANRYAPHPLASSDFILRHIIEHFEKRVTAAGVQYQQTNSNSNSQVELNGKGLMHLPHSDPPQYVPPDQYPDDKDDVYLWFDQALDQHHRDFYLNLMNGLQN